MTHPTFPVSEHILRKYTFAFFAGFLVLSLVEIFISYALRRDYRYPAFDITYFAVQWSIWTLLSPIIVHLAFRYPLSRYALPHWIVIHLMLGVLFLSLEFLIEIPTARLVKTWLCHQPTDTIAQYLAQYMTRFNHFLLIYLFVIVSINVYLYVARYHQATINRRDIELKAEQLRTQLADAQLQALKMQLDPHFLFNTHNAITGLMLNGENDRAIQMINGVSNLLRTLLESRDQQLASLGEELKLSRIYLDIQQIRFGDRLRVTIREDAGTLSFRVPHFILQPLIENAIAHGVEASLGAKFIELATTRVGDLVEITIVNSYNPSAKGWSGTGIGLANTRERLRHLYADSANIEFLVQPTTVTVRLIIPQLLATHSKTSANSHIVIA